MSQHERRATPAWWRWELPTAAGLGGLVLLALGVQVARSLAVWWSGQGWVWPTLRTLLVSVPGILAGDPAAGLGRRLGPIPNLQVWMAVVEFGVVVLIGWAAVWILQRLGPLRLRGVATSAEAEQLLGRGRLWRVRRIIRPDLVGPPAQGSRPPDDPVGNHSGSRR